MKTFKNGPLLSAGLLIGAGMGGFVDGILLHQILQWHNMMSNRIAPDTLVGSKINMFWDGIFHAGVWCMTAVGIWKLFRIRARHEGPLSGRIFGGALLMGFGLFNLIEGIINHQIWGLHHVNQYAGNKLVYDVAFLLSGALLALSGLMLIRSEQTR